jgi:hypothetical protein
MNTDKLTFRDLPFGLWLLDLGLIAAGIFFFVRGGVPAYLPMILAGLGLLALTFTYALTITADLQTRTLKLDYRSLLLHSVKEIPFEALNTIRIDSSTTRDTQHSNQRSTSYRIEAVLKDGQTVPFRAYYSSDFFLKQKRVDQLRAFMHLAETLDESPIGLFRAAPKIGAQMAQQQQEALTGPEAVIHETNGIHWQLQSAAMGAAPVTRWFSAGFKTQGSFLFLAQKTAGQTSTGGGFLAALGNTLFRTSLTLYGFKADETPGLEKAETLAPLGPGLEPHFTAFTSDTSAARQILNPWVELPLRTWAERYPLHQIQQGRFGQLVVLFSPHGVFLATLNVLQPDQVEELTALGVELVKAQGGGG